MKFLTAFLLSTVVAVPRIALRSIVRLKGVDAGFAGYGRA